MARARSYLSITAVVLVSCVLLLLSREYWLGALGAALVRADEPVKADMVMVLAGDFFGRRILKGAELVRQGYAPVVLVSGPSGYYGRYECDLAIAYAVERGYPREYFIAAPHNARSTEQEADALLPVLRKMGVHRYLLVTSDYHTRRAGRVFRSHAPDLDVHVVAAADERFSPDGWWHSREGWKICWLEWQKTVATAAGL